MNDPIESYKDELSSGSRAVVDSRLKLIAVALGCESPANINWRALNYQRAIAVVGAFKGR